MGKITIAGLACRYVKYDVMTLKVQFKTHKSSAAEALRAVTEESEGFLKIVTDEEIAKISDIKLSDNSTEQSYRDGKLDVSCSREFSFRVPFNMLLINRINKIVTENKYNASINTDFRVLNADSIRSELLTEAVDNSKKKAEQIAASLGKHLVELETVDIGDRYSTGNLCCERERGITASITVREPKISDELSANETKLEERVSAVWIIE